MHAPFRKTKAKVKESKVKEVEAEPTHSGGANSPKLLS
jgi:hypothetical protein